MYLPIKSKSNVIAGNVEALQEFFIHAICYQCLNETKRNTYTESLTPSVIGTGTFTLKTSGQPREVSRATETYDPENPSLVPLVIDGSKNYYEFTATTAGDGMRLALPSISISPNDIFGPIMMFSDNTKTINIVLTSTTSADTITFSNIALTGFQNGVWQRLHLEMANGTRAGTVDFSRFTAIQIISNGIAQTGAVYDLPTANNIDCFIGQKIIIPFVSIFDNKEKLDSKMEGIKSYLSDADVVSTNKDFEVELTTSDYNLSTVAGGLGTVMKNGVIPIMRFINAAGESQANPVANGSFVINGVDNLANLQVFTSDNIQLSRSNNLQTVGISTFFATMTAGVVTIRVDTSYNGQILIVKEEKLEKMSMYVNKNFKTSNYFCLIWGRLLSNGTVLANYLPRCKISKMDKKASKGTVETSYTFKALPKRIGKQLEFHREGFSSAL